MKFGMKKKALIASLLTFALCLGILAGATFALLTSESKINIVTTAGDVDVSAAINSFKLYSFDVEQEVDATDWAGKFANQGTAVLDAQTGELKIDNITPGDKAVIDIGITNLSDIAIKYRVEMNVIVPDTEGDSLKDILVSTATIDGIEYNMNSSKTIWFDAAPNETIGSIAVAIEFPGVQDEVTYGDENTHNKYSNKEATIQLTIKAVQANAKVADLNADVTANDFADTLANLKDESVELNVTETINWETGAAHGSTPFVPEGAATNELIIEGNNNSLVATGSGVGPIRAANGGTLVFRNVNFIDQSVSYAEDSWEFTYLEFAGNLVFENCTFNSGIAIDGENATFNNCKFVSTADSEYSVWVSNGKARFTNCEFAEGTRAAKMHEAYGSEIISVTFDNCTFGPLSKKPGIAIGTLNADTTVAITNCTFTDVQAGDQGLYMYETDTDVTTFDFTESGNTVVNSNP